MTKKTVLYWNPHQLGQTHQTSRPILLVSGCSFTDSLGYIEHPISWPGYLCERARFDQVIDVSCSGAGNEYICTSIVNQIESMTDEEINKTMVIIVWSGIGRKENLYQDARSGAKIDDIYFEQDIDSQKTFYPGEAIRSWKNIVMTQNYLENKKIPFGFSFFTNTFDPPFLPKRMASTVPWNKSLTNDKIQKLRQCKWIHDHKQCLFEYCFRNDLLGDDLFHPKPDGYLSWTDHVLLPGLVAMGLISPVDQ